MRRSIGTVLPVVAVLALAACGGEGAGDDDAAASPTSLTATAPAADGSLVLGAGDRRDGDGVQFVTTPPTTTLAPTTTSTPTTTLAPTTTTTSTTTRAPTTTSTSTTTSTTTTSTTTSTTSTSTTVPPPTVVRCSFDADALFEPGEATLTDDAITELAGLAADLGDDVRAVTVEGRTDHRGTEEENLSLSEARATAAAEALADAGIDETSITVIGYGEADAHQPADGSAPTDDEMAADRRVDIVIDADVAPATCTSASTP